MATKTYKATSVASTGTNWKNVSHAYDDNDSTSYAYRDYYKTSACHINGFNITDLPSDAIINTVTAYFKAATENSYGYFAGYIMCDAKTSASEYIKQSIFLNGKQQVSAQYYSMSVSGDELTNFATSNGLYGGSAVELLKNLRLRWVGGSTDTYYCQCQVFDTYVTIDYTVPTYALDLKGKLDNGTENDNISNWGTADIYINGSIVSSGVSDYYEFYTSGTTYEVKNIVANSGYKYVGNSSYSGTLTSNTTIVLPFETKTASTNMIYIGTKQPTFYIGTKQVQSIYLGMSLIYEIVQIVDSGTCGDNLTYTLDSNGVLTISGTGDMQNSSFGWDKDLIKSVVINDGVTIIGDEAFRDCTGLISATIGDSVTSIGRYAFFNCKSLTSVSIPDSVMSIGKYAFCNCTGLTDITIPNNVTSIDWGAFSGCTSLTSITIPDSVTSIGNSAFYYCTKLTEIDFSACTDIPTLESSDALSHTSSGLVIKVPSALLDEWKAATNWATYADKIVGV